MCSPSPLKLFPKYLVHVIRMFKEYIDQVSTLEERGSTMQKSKREQIRVGTLFFFSTTDEVARQVFHHWNENLVYWLGRSLATAHRSICLKCRSANSCQCAECSDSIAALLQAYRRVAVSGVEVTVMSLCLMNCIGFAVISSIEHYFHWCYPSLCTSNDDLFRTCSSAVMRCLWMRSS